MKHSAGDTLTFHRNAVINHNSAEILAVDKDHSFYIIESEHGWTPDIIRLKKYKLDAKKKYLFVQEDELSEIKKEKAKIVKSKPKKKKK